jgi:flagellar protein FlaI
MATGHAVYSTMHADSVPSAVYRLENEPINVPRIMLQTVDAFVIQAQVRVHDRMVRRIKEVCEIVGIDEQTGDLLTNTVFRWDGATDRFVYMGKSHILDHLREKKNVPREKIEQEWHNRTRVIEWMVRNKIRHYRDVAAIVSAYYRAPEAVLARVAADIPAPASRVEPAKVERAGATIVPTPPRVPPGGPP